MSSSFDALCHSPSSSLLCLRLCLRLCFCLCHCFSTFHFPLALIFLLACCPSSANFENRWVTWGASGQHFILFCIEHLSKLKSYILLKGFVEILLPDFIRKLSGRYGCKIVNICISGRKVDKKLPPHVKCCQGLNICIW